jgi:purine-cytosine permease-like protein
VASKLSNDELMEVGVLNKRLSWGPHNGTPVVILGTAISSAGNLSNFSAGVSTSLSGGGFAIALFGAVIMAENYLLKRSFKTIYRMLEQRVKAGSLDKAKYYAWSARIYSIANGRDETLFE